MIISYGTSLLVKTGQFKWSFDRYYVTDSPLRVTNIAELAQFRLNWPLMIIPHGTGQIVQLDSFYVTDSPLSVTNIAKFYLNWPVLLLIP